MNDRYARHSLINWFSQDEVAAKRVCVVGAGAIGNEVIKNLALLGVGYIAVIDFDTIEEHNLTRSVLFRTGDVGRKKADVAAERARELDPNCDVVSHCIDLGSALSVDALQTYDVVLCCVDNFEARMRLNEMCRIAGVDYVDLAIDSQYASVSVFPFGTNTDIACYECNLPSTAYQQVAERYSCGHLKRVAYEEKKVPTTIVTSSVVGSIGVSFALRLGGGSVRHDSYRILINTLGGTSTVTPRLVRSNDCPCCSRLGPDVVLIRVSRSSVLSEIGKALGVSDSTDWSVRLSDPVLVLARCAHCGFQPGEGTLIGKPSSQFDESIRLCLNCRLQSVGIIFEEEFSLSALAALYQGKTIPVSYALVSSEDFVCCVSFQE